MPQALLDKYRLSDYPYRINWEITTRCNFNCNYCINPDVNTGNLEPVYSPAKIRQIFDNTGKSWLIMITGGEPFVYPDFIEVCKALSQNHYLQITTNLSSSGIYRFGEEIDPSRIFTISASMHLPERLRNNRIDDFFKKLDYLQSKNFPVLVNYIAHPDVLHRMDADFIDFKKRGICAFALLLRGIVNGKQYPDAYSDEEMEMILKYVLDKKVETKAAHGHLDFYGHYCNAGDTYLYADCFGNIKPCATLSKNLGNIFTQGIPMNGKPMPCYVHNCNDVYCGIAALTNKKACSIWMKWLRIRDNSAQ